MQILLQSVSKKFNRSWIFRNIDYSFQKGEKYAILGGNGSGKSTLLQIISGYQSPTSGLLTYTVDGKQMTAEAFWKYVSIATPYLDIPEEFTLSEMLAFHARFRRSKYRMEEILDILSLRKERDKEIKNFSSGMRQRVRLGLAILFDTPVILLDEPTTHLDTKAIEWYKELVLNHTENRCLIISSNQEEEYSFCDHQLMVENYK